MVNLQLKKFVVSFVIILLRVASILKSNKRGEYFLICGGVLVSNKHVLTGKKKNQIQRQIMF
jgi:hypothetical protein